MSAKAATPLKRKLLNQRLNKTLTNLETANTTPIWKKDTNRRKTFVPILKPKKSEAKAVDTDDNICPEIKLNAKKKRMTEKHKSKCLDEYDFFDELETDSQTSQNMDLDDDEVLGTPKKRVKLNESKQASAKKTKTPKKKTPGVKNPKKTPKTASPKRTLSAKKQKAAIKKISSANKVVATVKSKKAIAKKQTPKINTPGKRAGTRASTRVASTSSTSTNINKTTSSPSKRKSNGKNTESLNKRPKRK